MISVHRRTPLSTEKSEEAVADFEPADIFGRLSFEWLAEISDAGMELLHCAGFSFDRAAARRLDRPRCPGRRNVRVLRHSGCDARTSRNCATRPLNDRSLGRWPIYFESGPSNGARQAGEI